MVTSSQELLLPHDAFFGELQSRQSIDGITLSHRIAAFSPEEVTVHTHLEAHFVLITSGRYVSSAKSSSAKAVADRGTKLIYNPPGTTHRDHFQDGKGSFFTISVSNRRLAETTDAEMLHVASYLGDRRACGLAWALLMECTRWDACSSLKAESLYLELAGTASHSPISVGPLPRRWLRAA
jgi:AraC family transcriptional regulator